MPSSSSSSLQHHQQQNSPTKKRTSRGKNGGFGRKPTNKLDPEEEIAFLQRRIDVETPARGSVPYANAKGDDDVVVAFGSLPISQATLQGLTCTEYTSMTLIQRTAIPHALAGRDILGAASTGSGKTLAFLVPLLESLYRQQWSKHVDGIGAIVLAPTRELAGQIFAVLRKIGTFHSQLSIGLLIGGQNRNRRRGFGNSERNEFAKEQQAIPSTNILICTPGRLLQHLEQTPYMNVDNLQTLVLDEADRILDLGFRDQLTKILDYLPASRQTLLFSATQTKDVKHLATMSINRDTVEYVGVKDPVATPKKLTQSYVVVPLEHKLNCLYSFLKSHLKSKTICFLASCSQVRFVWELFRQLRPGLSVLAIHGKLSQQKRLQVYDKFTNLPNGVVLLATDVASRGLDFPYVDWVVQVDAPEDKDMYVHRVGRTARFQEKGNALLLLDPEEEPCIAQNEFFTSQTIPLSKKSINPTKTMLVSQRAAALVAEQSHGPLHSLAKKAFLSYVRSLTLLPRSSASKPPAFWTDMDITKLNLEAYATSMGLAAMPNIDGILSSLSSSLGGGERERARKSKNTNRKLQKLKEQIRLEKEAKRNPKRKAIPLNEDKDEDEDDLLVVKKRHVHLDDNQDLPLSSPATMRHPKKIRIDGSNSTKNRHTVFQDDGTEQPKLLELSTTTDTSTIPSNETGAKLLQEANDIYMERVRQRLEQTKELDKHEERERIRAKHKKQKRSEETKEDRGDNIAVVLGDKDSSHNEANFHNDTSSDTDGDDTDDNDNDSSTPTSSSSSSSSDNDDFGEENDLAAAERLALSFIRDQS